MDDDLTLDWPDLRGNFIADLVWTSAYHEWHREHEGALRTTQWMAVQWAADPPVPLVEHLACRLPKGPLGPNWRRGYYRVFIAEAAVRDVMFCAEYRAFNSPTDNFRERLFHA